MKRAIRTAVYSCHSGSYLCCCYSLNIYRPTLQRTNNKNSKQIFPEKELRGHSPSFHMHVSVSNLYIITSELPILLQEMCGPILGI
jgi:hypothetical protein